MSQGITQPEWFAMVVAGLAAFWSTVGNWFVERWIKKSDRSSQHLKDDINRDQRLLQLESDHAAHKQTDDLRFGFIQQSLTRVEGYVAEIRHDVSEIMKEGKRNER